MTISRNEEGTQIGQPDETDHLRFTEEFQSLMGDLGWEAKAFVGHSNGAMPPIAEKTSRLRD
jgi:hypothetical protein